MTDTPARPKDFLREIIDEHCRRGTYGGRVVTRFPPEPNGYLHIGHAKSICLNFGLAQQYGGACNLRMDDTNPTTEDPEYVASIQADVRWLGFQWAGFFHASDYFEQLYQFAEQLIRAGKAYVCSLSEADMRAYRGTVTEPGRPSPYRDRSVDENLDLFRRMRAGEFPDGAHTLRAKCDMSAANMKMRDAPLYRIRRAHHYRTGDAWSIYPLYDFAHCLSDQIEGITHSICTLEFENNRELYDWILDALVPEPRPHQYEFARLAITYTVLSKRKLLELVEGEHVSGWDDPRMPTLSGLRRRGYTPEAIRAFADAIGVAKTNSVVDVALLESCVRDDLNRRAPRVLAVLDPLKVTLTNVAEGEVETLEAPYFPADVPEGSGARALPLSRTILIEREDFAETPPKGWHRLAPGGEVRLRHAVVIRCDEVIKDDRGEVVELRCSVDRTGEKKPKGTIHWVGAAHAVDAEVRLYDRLFSVENPDRGDADYKTFLNPQSLVIKLAKVEPSVASASPGALFQFERHGFFCVDPETKAGALVFNRTVALKDSWAKQQRAEAPEKGQSKPAPKPEAAPRPAAQSTPKPAARSARELSPEAAVLRDRHGLSPDDARVIADSGLTALFEAAVASGAKADTAGTLVGSELDRAMKAEARGVDSLAFGGRELAELAALVDDGTLGAKLAREVIAELLKSGGSPKQIVEQRGFRQVSDEGALGAAIDAVLAAKADLVARYRGGETKLYGVLVGELMKATGGKANAKLAGDLLRRKLG
ncbi:MAG: glutamine--tRNA ligase/YqeY domain fusion protein [Deltaproteobacteria bacterium]|nr:glutamine--tRNA ligase/YqeY domain fusion protein [Deltaproteobacteria bacterium]